MLTDEEIDAWCAGNNYAGTVPGARRLARKVEAEATAPLLARIAELERFKDAYDAWQEKTEWVQTTATAGELGKHRADVLRERIEKLKSALSAAPGTQPAPKPLGWVRPNPGAISGLFEYGTECPPGWVGSAFSVLASAVPTAQPMTDVVRKALDRAFVMGQNYWADADSESYSANKRSDVTRQKFNAMRDEVCAQLDGIKEQP